MKSLRTVFSGFVASVTVTLLKATTSNAQSEGIRSGVQAARGADQPADLFGDGAIFTTIVDLMLFVVGAVAVVMIIYGGFRYIVSGGNAANVTAAKNTILYAIVGVIVALLAYAIIDFVLNNFGGSSNSGL